MLPQTRLNREQRKSLNCALAADNKTKSQFSVNFALLCIVKTVVGEKEYYLIYLNRRIIDYSARNVMLNL